MPSSDFRRANQLVRENRLEEAVAAYRSAIAQNPNFSHYYWNLGQTLEKLGHSNEAAEIYACAKNLQNYGEVYVYSRATSKTKNATANKNIKIKKTEAEEYYKLGEEKANNQEWEDAIFYYQKAIELNAELAGAYQGLGDSFKQVGKLDEAINSYQKAVHIDPESHISVYKNLGQLLQIQGYDDSISAQVLEDCRKLNEIQEKPIVTVVVPTFNCETFLEECLDSLLKQSFQKWECIIVNDCSTDCSLQIAKQYSLKDSRFQVKNHSQNSGLSASRNTGLKLARGKYITFLDCDDFLLPHSLEERFNYLDKDTDPSVAGYYCGIVSVPEEVRLSNSQQYENTFQGQLKDFISCAGEAPFNAHAPLLKKEVLEKFGGFDETMLYGAEDWDCWYRLMRHGYCFKPSDRIGAVYRQKRNSMVRTMPIEHLLEAHRLASSSSKIVNDLNHKSAVYCFNYPWHYYADVISFSKRVIQFATMCYMSSPKEKSMEAINQALKYIPKNSYFYLSRHLNIEGLIHSGVRRFLACDVSEYRSRKQELSPTIETIEKNIYERLKQPEEARLETNQSRKKAIKTISKYQQLEEHPDFESDAEEIRQFYNIHAGQRCFIVGNGPSLNLMDLDKLADEYTFAVNAIFYKTDEVGFLPTYYVVEDNSVMKENLVRIKQYQPKKHKFFPSIYRKLHPKDDNVSFFTMNRGFYEKNSPNYCIPRFSTDISERIYCGQSVTYINLQIAFYMGFTEVYLIGMDFSYSIPKSAKRKGDIFVSTEDDVNHFHKDYFGKGKTWKDPKLDRVLQNYKMAKFIYESAGRKIWNATKGGKLELFDRCDYESLFES